MFTLILKLGGEGDELGDGVGFGDGIGESVGDGEESV